MPAEPTLRNASAFGNTVPAADDSVRLNICSIGMPRACTAFNNVGGTGAPPEHAMRHEERSAVAKRG